MRACAVSSKGKNEGNEGETGTGPVKGSSLGLGEEQGRLNSRSFSGHFNFLFILGKSLGRPAPLLLCHHLWHVELI